MTKQRVLGKPKREHEQSPSPLISQIALARRQRAVFSPLLTRLEAETRGVKPMRFVFFLEGNGLPPYDIQPVGIVRKDMMNPKGGQTGKCNGEDAVVDLQLSAPGTAYFGDRQSGIFSYAHKIWNDGYATMALVGSFPPNPWGLHDMHGNVSEMTSTPYHPSRHLVKYDPNLGGVAKGGSWLGTAAYSRCATRIWSNIAENAVGLRFVLRTKEADSAVAAPAPKKPSLK